MNISFTDIWNIAFAIITALGGGGAIVFALSAWLGKVWANRIMESDWAKHQKDLESDKAKYQTEFAELKTELDKHLHAHNIAIERLDKQRTQAIRDIYDALTAWFEAYLNATQLNINLPNDPTKSIETYKQLGYALYAASDKLSKEYLRTAIDFKEETCKTITECGQCTMEMSTKFHNSVNVRTNPNSPKHLQTIKEARTQLETDYATNFKPKQEQLITTFRKIIDPVV
jgi:hypothetical protein